MRRLDHRFSVFLAALLVAGIGPGGCSREEDGGKPVAGAIVDREEHRQPDSPAGASSSGAEVAAVAEPAAIASPLADGWESEALAEAAAGRLHELADAVVAGTAGDPVDAGLRAVFADLGPGFADRHAEVHVFAVTLGGGGREVTTSATFEGVAADGSSVVAAEAVWDARWRRAGGAGPGGLELVSLAIRDVHRSGGARWFTERTGAVLGGGGTSGHQIAAGLNHWLGRVERIHGMDAFLRNGLAVGDADGDGLDDLYLCQPGGLPNRLFLHRPDGTAEDHSGAAGVDFLDQTSAALFVDLDNDGDQDLALAVPAGVLLLENAGRASFSRRSVLPSSGSDVHALAAADYDLDGRLDLYLTVAMADPRADADAPRFVYHDANDGGANHLFRNEGDWGFADVTAAVGLDRNNSRHSLAAGWCDYDLDGDPDLYVANDYGQNNLYRNDPADDGSRRFTDVAVEAGAVDFGSGMSVSWGDYDRDGVPDLYVGNMFSNAGHRVTGQEAFATGEEGDGSLRALYRRFAKGNSLFRGLGDGRFQEVGATAGVEHGRWAWSSLFADLDHDGWEDLFVANGYITGDGPGDL